MSEHGERQRWRIWRRHWERERQCWSSWTATETVFSDGEYSDYAQLVSDDQSEFQIRSEPYRYEFQCARASFGLEILRDPTGQRIGKLTGGALGMPVATAPPNPSPVIAEDITGSDEEGVLERAQQRIFELAGEIVNRRKA